MTKTRVYQRTKEERERQRNTNLVPGELQSEEEKGNLSERGLHPVP
jgi:hypothetical protein